MELDARERLELGVENDLRELAVNVERAGWQGGILLRHKHFCLECGIITISGDAKLAWLKTIESTAKVTRVGVEPVGVN